MPTKPQTPSKATDQTFENWRQPAWRDEILNTMQAIVPWAVLGEGLLAQVGAELQARGYRVNTGTTVDATNIAAPSFAKNAGKARGPEMHRTRKGQPWHFGTSVHIGVGSQGGPAHRAVVTAANVLTLLLHHSPWVCTGSALKAHLQKA